MRIERFEDIIAWKKAKELTISVYNLYRDNRDFEFKDELQRIPVSTPYYRARPLSRRRRLNIDIYMWSEMWKTKILYQK